MMRRTIPVMTVCFLHRQVGDDDGPKPMLAQTKGGLGAQKVRCGPATVLQLRPPSHGLHCLLRSIRVRLAIECPIGPLCCSLTSLGLGWRCGLPASGLYRRGTLHYGLSSGHGVHAAFHVGSGCTWGVFAAAGPTRPHRVHSAFTWALEARGKGEVTRHPRGRGGGGGSD